MIVDDQPMLGSVEAVGRALSAVEGREATVRAWAHLAPELAQDRARAVDRRPDRPLRGIVLGAKDVFDTGDMPTEYGSVIYRGHRPRADAAVVAQLQLAGAVCLGKTVTAEFAVVTPGPTTNPHRASHTPGGSSMGSAAAVATGMADLALGTQTAGSIIRPASFCGVYGYKPTFGSVSIAGLKLVAPSLDTVGFFGRSVAVIDRARVVVTGRMPAEAQEAPPCIGVYRTEHWDLLERDGRRALDAAALFARGAGAAVSEVSAPDGHLRLGEQQPKVMAYEASRALAWERVHHSAILSPALRDLLDWGSRIPASAYDEAKERGMHAARGHSQLFGTADVLLTPAVPGEAPEGLASTGDPRFARMWTLLGYPTLSVPGLTGASGLPIGVQLVGRPGDDARLLAVGAWLGRILDEAPPGTS
ncbi:MAG: amidase [Microbacterium sp.]